MTDEMKLTPEVTVTNNSLYLIRIDGEELAFVKSEAEAKLVIDSIAAAEVGRLENEWTKVFRRDQTDGKKVTIATQSLGVLVNGKVSTAMKIDCIVVPGARLLRGRLEHKPAAPVEPTEEGVIPPPPPAPTPELLEKLRLRREAIEPKKKSYADVARDAPEEIVESSDEEEESSDDEE